MLFNSIDFAVFLPIVFLIYWFLVNGNLKLQNGFILLASYFFYSWWDWRFSLLILFSTVVDFFVGKLIHEEKDQSTRKKYLYISICTNIGLLFFFKYFNFFIDSFVHAFSLFGQDISGPTLNIILPVGISFYTFQTLSYTIDVYRGKMESSKDFVSFAAFVCFFPQLLAGPIERASHLLPQFIKKRTFDYNFAVDGMRQILWGLFKKIVIADNCAIFVNQIFGSTSEMSASTLLLGSILFLVQLYCDFSGYSDMAIGMAKLFGFNLRQNFAFPLFSRDIAEFWRRWHISLTTWFRDYVYIPLGGSRQGKWKTILNVCIVFVVSGFWHGAQWHYVFWGALNGLLFLPLMITNRHRSHMDLVATNKWLPSIRELAKMISTFILMALTFIFFRAENLTHAFDYLKRMISLDIFTLPQLLTPKTTMVYCLILLLPLFVVEWIHRERPHGLEIAYLSKPVRWVIYITIILSISVFGYFGENEFIYFQF